MRVVLVVLLLGTGVSLATPLAGQARPQTREGVWMAAGLGWASLGCADCGGDRESGLGWYLGFGGTVSKRVLLGGEGAAWVKEVDGVTITHLNVSGMIYVYPAPASGFFLRAGAGLSDLSAEVFDIEFGIATGFGATVGLGYDGRITDNYSLVPFANYLFGSFDSGRTNVIQIGLGVTMH